MNNLSRDSIGKNGMVSTPHPLATKAALAVLQEGGNAVDAAIAANTTLAVLLPDQCGLGGDLFAIVCDPQDHKSPVHVLNASGWAPAAASVAEMRRLGHQAMPQLGPLAVTTPGAVQGWGRLSERWGKLPWEDLFKNAFNLASQGFQVNLPLSRSIHAYASMLASSGAAKIFAPGGNPIKLGDKLVQDQLSNTLRMVMDKGWNSFYTGDAGKTISQAVLSEGGLLDWSDVKDYGVEWTEPVSTEYRECQVFTTPPNSRGILLLAVLEHLNKLKLDTYKYQSPEFISLLVDLFRQVIENLEGLLGDPRFGGFPSAPWAVQDNANPARKETAPPVKLKGDTISLCVADQDGMGISLIQSVYHDFGSGVFVEPVGIFLQNRGASFNFEKDHPNCLAPRKRPLHTLMPSLVMKDDKLSMLLGTRGGAGQPQTLAQLLTAVIDYGLSAKETLDLPRWIYGSTTSARQTDGLILESSIPQEVGECLRKEGLTVQFTNPLSVNWMGCAQMILVDQKDGTFYGGADSRGGGLAEGY